MAKRGRRKKGWIIGGIVLLVLAVGLAIPCAVQNYQVQAFFNGYFTAIRQKDRERITKGYLYLLALDQGYVDQLLKYELLGWKITGLTGQPLPRDVPHHETNFCSAELYYRLPDRLVQPAGRYRRIDHPRYGACAVVPVTLEYAYWPDFPGHWYIAHPNLLTGRNWAAPFEQPLRQFETETTSRR